MRAKLVVESVEPNGDSESLKMRAVSREDTYPEDGSDENNTYAKFSPSATFEILISNPDLHGKFSVGQQFYVDFTEVKLAQTDGAAVAEDGGEAAADSSDAAADNADNGEAEATSENAG